MVSNAPSRFYNVHGESIKWGTGSVVSPTPDLPDRLKYNLGWSSKKRTANPEPTYLDLSHPGIPSEALTFYCCAKPRNHIIHQQVKNAEFSEFRKHCGTDYCGPSVLKQHFSLSNTPTHLEITTNHSMPPMGNKCDFWNIEKQGNFSSVR
jgi:hypothetical protein